MTCVNANLVRTARAATNRRRRLSDERLVTVQSVTAAATAARGAPYDAPICRLTLCSVDDPSAVVAPAAAGIPSGGVHVYVTQKDAHRLMGAPRRTRGCVGGPSHAEDARQPRTGT